MPEKDREFTNVCRFERLPKNIMQHFCGMRPLMGDCDYEVVRTFGSHFGDGRMAIITWGKNIPANTVTPVVYEYHGLHSGYPERARERRGEPVYMPELPKRYFVRNDDSDTLEEVVAFALEPDRN